MTPTVARNVRIAFASFSLALTVFAGVESLTRTATADAATACGTAEHPCSLAPLTVTAEPAAPAQLAKRPLAESVSVQDAAMHQVSVRKS